MNMNYSPRVLSVGTTLLVIPQFERVLPRHLFFSRVVVDIPYCKPCSLDGRIGPIFLISAYIRGDEFFVGMRDGT